MTDPVSTAALALQATKTGEAVGTAAAKPVGELLTRLLGPTVDEMSRDLLEKYKARRVERVVRRAAHKADLSVHGYVAARVVAGAFEAVEWSDDEFLAEYLSGVLASSRSEDGGDDRGIAWIGLIKTMPVAQIHLHLAIYSAARRLVTAKAPEDRDATSNQKMFFSDSELVAELGETVVGLLKEDDGPATDPGGIHAAFHGLQALGLIRNLSHGDGEFLSSSEIHDFGEGGFVFGLTTRGAQLFMAAHGLGHFWAGALYDTSLRFADMHQELGMEPSRGGKFLPM